MILIFIDKDFIPILKKQNKLILKRNLGELFYWLDDFLFLVYEKDIDYKKLLFYSGMFYQKTDLLCFVRFFDFTAIANKITSDNKSFYPDILMIHDFLEIEVEDKEFTNLFFLNYFKSHQIQYFKSNKEGILDIINYIKKLKTLIDKNKAIKVNLK